MRCQVGIDLGGTVVKIGIVSDGRVLGVRKIDTEASRRLTTMLPKIEDAIVSLLEERRDDTVELAGIVLAFPGIVDFKGKKAAATNAKYDDAPSIDLQEWAVKKFDVPFAIDNDARMALIGEWLYGAGMGSENMVMMTIGTGIGTGAIVDSRPLYGHNWCAGSLGGHMTVDYRGRKCTCGNIGCVEAHSSSFFLPQIIREHPEIAPGFRDDVSNYNFKTLFGKYREGDRDATIVVTECMDVWSAGIVEYIHAYDPEIVVIGGGVMRSEDIILPYIRQKVEKYSWQPITKVKIAASSLGDDAALLSSSYYFNGK